MGELAVPQDPVGELEAAGFQDCVLINSPDLVIKAEAYNDFTQNMIQNSAFRTADAFFSRLDDQELAALEAHVQKKFDSGELEAYMAERHALRGEPKKGHVAAVCGIKYAAHQALSSRPF